MASDRDNTALPAGLDSEETRGFRVIAPTISCRGQLPEALHPFRPLSVIRAAATTSPIISRSAVLLLRTYRPRGDGDHTDLSREGGARSFPDARHVRAGWSAFDLSVEPDLPPGAQI
jgi:hypothetical protein